MLGPLIFALLAAQASGEPLSPRARAAADEVSRVIGDARQRMSAAGLSERLRGELARRVEIDQAGRAALATIYFLPEDEKASAARLASAELLRGAKPHRRLHHGAVHQALGGRLCKRRSGAGAVYRAVATDMYTFLYVSPTGELPSFEFATCPNAEAAYQNAKLLLARWPERKAVEVWDETERLCVVQRSGYSGDYFHR